MEINGKNVRLMFTIKAVDSIPCDLKGETIAFDSENNMISDPIKTPWPMPWVTEEIVKLAGGNMPAENKFKVYNPEEPDQYVFVEVQRF